MVVVGWLAGAGLAGVDATAGTAQERMRKWRDEEREGGDEERERDKEREIESERDG